VAAVAVVDAQEVGKPYVTLTGVAAEKKDVGGGSMALQWRFTSKEIKL
jgi:hypothetical protein